MDAINENVLHFVWFSCFSHSCFIPTKRECERECASVGAWFLQEGLKAGEALCVLGKDFWAARPANAPHPTFPSFLPSPLW